MKAVLGFLATSTAEPTWEEYKAEYGLAWNSDTQDAEFEKAYNGNVAFIQETNVAQNGFKLGVNKFSFLTTADFLSFATGEREEDEDMPVLDIHSSSSVELTSTDWAQDSSVMNPIRDQGHCGSCWAFATTNALETSYAIDVGTLHQLSEQFLIDCDTENNGCDGGSSSHTLGTFFKEKGHCRRSDYSSYSGSQHSCKSCSPVIQPGVVTGKSSVSANADSLKSALLSRPIKMSMKPDDYWHSYKSGVAKDKTCYTSTSHAVVAVGYSSTSHYFKIRNSWGQDWGDNGYIKLSYESSCSDGAWAMFHKSGIYPNIGSSPSPSPDTRRRRRRSSSCNDNPSNWANTDGETCSVYSSLDYCTSSGGEGSGWHSSWGTISDWPDKNGNTAADACCACGGGSASMVV